MIKKSQVQIGETYIAKVSGQLVKIRITAVSQYGGWDALNLKTKKRIRIKTAARLSWPGVPKEVAPWTRLAGFAEAAHKVSTENRILNGKPATEVIQ